MFFAGWHANEMRIAVATTVAVRAFTARIALERDPACIISATLSRACWSVPELFLSAIARLLMALGEQASAQPIPRRLAQSSRFSNT